MGMEYDKVSHTCITLSNPDIGFTLKVTVENHHNNTMVDALMQVNDGDFLDVNPIELWDFCRKVEVALEKER